MKILSGSLSSFSYFPDERVKEVSIRHYDNSFIAYVTDEIKTYSNLLLIILVALCTVRIHWLWDKIPFLLQLCKQEIMRVLYSLVHWTFLVMSTMITHEMILNVNSIPNCCLNYKNFLDFCTQVFK